MIEFALFVLGAAWGGASAHFYRWARDEGHRPLVAAIGAPFAFLGLAVEAAAVLAVKAAGLAALAMRGLGL
jgi:hypothetical protein